MSDLSLGLLKFPQFFQSQMGVDGHDDPLGIRTGGGMVFYVGTTVGNVVARDVNDGTDPLNPLATLGQAVTNCTTNAGDVIVVLPGNYTLAATLTIDKARVRLVSWDYLRGQHGPSTAILSATDDFDLINIEEDQVEIAGFRIANGSAITALDCIEVGTSGAVIGCHIHHNRFSVGGGYGVEIGSASGTVNDITIENNSFFMMDDNANAAGVYIGYSVRAMVRNNFFWADEDSTYAVSVRNASTPGSIVYENDMAIVNTAGVAVLRGASSDVAIHRNYISGTGTATTAITQQADGGDYAVGNVISDNTGGVQVDATT